MAEANDWRDDRIGAAERGENPTVMARMPSGFAVIGDTQFLPGYCVLLATPRVDHLSDLPRERRVRFLLDMSLLGEAIEAACRPRGLRRVNYSILGNTDPFLHAHVFPRYEWEPPGRIGLPVWSYPRDRWTDARFAYSDETHGELRERITAELLRLMARRGAR
jgi:diadenosine tetraphosphate (Ap4A) HIT family hydrolase